VVRVVAVANQKGGVGKTTTTVSVAAALGRAGHPTLVIDLDPQANASQALGIDRSFGSPSVYEVLLDGASIADVLLQTNEPNVSCVTSSVDLAGAEVELVGLANREGRLAAAIEAMDFGEADAPSPGAPEIVLIDCPPSLGLLTVNALVAADELLVPVQAEFYALDGVGQLIRTMELVRTALNPRLQISLVVLTMIGPSTSAQDHIVDQVRAFFGSRLAPTMIPRDPALCEAPILGSTVMSLAPHSLGASAYVNLARDLLAVQITTGKHIKT
jgi:chromosome partitioning protein